jgi:hypothetical protein
MAVVACLFWLAASEARSEPLQVLNNSDNAVIVLIRARHAPARVQWTELKIPPGKADVIQLTSNDSFDVRLHVILDEHQFDEYGVDDFAVKTLIQLGKGAYDVAIRKWKNYQWDGKNWIEKRPLEVNSEDFDFFTEDNAGRLVIPESVSIERSWVAVRPKKKQ